jgi:hypothetical protein
MSHFRHAEVSRTAQCETRALGSPLVICFIFLFFFFPFALSFFYLFIFLSLALLEFELGAWHLLNRFSTTRALPLALLCLDQLGL